MLANILKYLLAVMVVLVMMMPGWSFAGQSARVQDRIPEHFGTIL